ncbi:MAG: hypothetical protein SGILL_004188 [Bacillariaceae sp.]
MASLVWMTIFLILAIELIITLILVVPVPRKARNAIAKAIFQLQLEDKLRTPIAFVGIALGLALMESYFTHQRIMVRILDEQEAVLPSHAGYHHDHFYPGLHDRERKYKSERNIYLAGFALTLLFVIGRLVVLLQESVELHEEIDRVVGSNDESNEMTTAAAVPIKSKQEKKVD